MKTALRYDWTKDEVKEIFSTPFLDLVHRAAGVHRAFQDPREVQVCSLLSVKTGACPEDCKYCSQSAHYKTEVKPEKLISVERVREAAEKAKAGGATRFCMGAAWREVRNNADFEKVLEMVRCVRDCGLEVCATLGMLTEEQARRLHAAGLYAYNHNLDTSEEFYPQVISTRTYADRLRTLDNVRKAGLTVCCGGILGLGESDEDRISLLHTLATLTPHPESVPVNTLVQVEGTPLAKEKTVSTWTIIRMIATARILMPASMVRLSAGRMQLSPEAQALAFLAGANSIFAGEKLLTTPNPDWDEDSELFRLLGLKSRPAYKQDNAKAA